MYSFTAPILLFLAYGVKYSTVTFTSALTATVSQSRSENSGFNQTDNSTLKVRVKRYIGSDTIYFSETELEMRKRIEANTQLDLALLPKFGGKDADRPYANLIQVLTHTRSNIDGPVDGTYDHTSGDTISVSVDPVLHRFTKGRWAVFGGARHQRCMPQRLFGNGYKFIFDCFAEGTYYVFFRIDGIYQDEKDVIDGIPFHHPDEQTLFFDPLQFITYILQPTIFFTDYEKALLQDPDSVTKPWFFSDPIKIVKNAYCYRWSYRLIKDNEVGFVHLSPNPAATGGVYKEYTLKVWIADPSEVVQEELYSSAFLHPSQYSQILTRRFFLGGLVPCLRFAHPAIEVDEDAVYMKDGDVRGVHGRFDSARLYGPHWRFKIKVFFDRIVSTLSDIVFTITPRQHSSLYECFIADIRVNIPSSPISFLPNAKVNRLTINLKYSWLSAVERRFLSENVVDYYGYEVVYVGPPYLNDTIHWIPIFSNPCINQELSFSWNGIIGMTWDFCTSHDLVKTVLPSFDKERLGLNADTLQLSDQERRLQLERSNNFSYAKDPSLRIRLFDMAYTPVGIMFLLDDSSVLLHSSDLGLRGIGFNTFTRKYKLGSLVKRRWCARSATPKSHNMWVPAFARDAGNIIIIVQIPLEGTKVITQQRPKASCEDIHDPTVKEPEVEAISEKQIHRDEADDARVDRVVEEKLRTKSAELKLRNRNLGRRPIVRKTIKDVEGENTFWLSGDVVLEGTDPHYTSRETDSRKVRATNTGLEKYNQNIIFRVDSGFNRIRSNFEANGLSFDMDELVFGRGGVEMIRFAPNNKLFRFHSVEFTGVEKLYITAVGFQSVEFPKQIITINSTVLVICTFEAQDVPIVLTGVEGNDEVELEDVLITFTGLIIRRIQTSRLNQTSQYHLTEAEYLDDELRFSTPLPLSKHTATLNPINTAIPLYILRINDVILFASLDGSFAKPVLYYQRDPTPNNAIEADAFLPFDNFDVIVTEQGIVSVLSRKEWVDTVPVTASEAFIGSVLANEPLRYVHPFHVSNNVFQASTEEGEVIYGKLSYNNDTETFDGPPLTEMLNVPFWSLLKGSFARSAGENQIPLGQRVVPTEGTSGTSFADPICPFASFEVFYVALPFVEAGYTTRITAEVAFYGDVIPLEADIIVEFSEIQGVSVVVSSFLEVQFDQTIIRKTIEMESFLPDPILQTMHSLHDRSQTDETENIAEQVRVFTITIRPSVLNLHCDKENYFRTIQLNVGCVTLTTMRLIGEAVPVTKIPVQPWTRDLESGGLKSLTWYHDTRNSETTGVAHLIVSKESVHKAQFKTFDCSHEDYCRIPIPAGKGIANSVYGLSFRDILIPKFEQFLSIHARRVTGNVVMYDILDAYKDTEFQMEANTTEYNAGCLVNGSDWYDKMAQKANFFTKELPVYADIYRYYRDCFSRRPSLRQADARKVLPLLPIQDLNSVEFFLFNQTNRNALRLKRKRNYIYLIRAVVVNTESNRFTYCQKLDTFFVLQVVNIIQQKKVIESFLPFIYLSIFGFIFLVVLISYFYFARNIVWSVDVEPTKNIHPDEEARMVEELRKRYERPRSPYGRLAKRIADMEKIQRAAKEYHTSRLEERENLLGSSKRAKSESAKERVSSVTSLAALELKNTAAKERIDTGSDVPKASDPTAADFGQASEPEIKRVSANQRLRSTLNTEGDNIPTTEVRLSEAKKSQLTSL